MLKTIIEMIMNDISVKEADAAVVVADKLNAAMQYVDVSRVVDSVDWSWMNSTVGR